MKIDLDKLERKAKAATPGCLLDDNYMGWTQQGWSLRTRSHRYGTSNGDDMARARADAALVSAVDRDTVLAMIARIRELEGAYRQLMHDHVRDVDESAMHDMLARGVVLP